MTAKTETCVTISCDTCPESFGDYDLSNTWHFDSIAAAIKCADEQRGDEEDGEDRDIYGWVIMPDGSATCQKCREVAHCATNGHTRYQSLYSSRVTCRTCGEILGPVAVDSREDGDVDA